jgi:hypothetical protein
MNQTGISLLIALSIAGGAVLFDGAPSEARKSKDKHATKSGSKTVQTNATTDGATAQPTQATPSTKTPEASDSSDNNVGPVVVAPSSLVDLTTAKFGRLDISLKDASFLEAQVRDLRLSAENMDMTKGTLESLSIQVDGGTFQEFTIDSLRMWTRGMLDFNVQKLLNDKVLQFREPAVAHARVSVTQASFNKFLNAPSILDRLSGSAKKRVPILSSLARKDVNFGFTFQKGDVVLEPENHIRLTMDSKLGMGKMGIPVKLSADTKVQLLDGWVNFEDTRLVTGGQAVPHDMAEKIINRINSLSKWGTQSDDIQFRFTDLDVLPGDRLELEGSAMITRLRFARNQEDKITPPEAAPEQPSNPVAPTTPPSN